MIQGAVLYVGLAQSLFAASILGTKRDVSIPDKILLLCLLTIALRFLVKILTLEGFDFINPDLSVPIIPLTFGPYLYLYARYLINGKTRFHRINLLHFIPFILVMLILWAYPVSFNVTKYFEKDGLLWIRALFSLIFYSSVLIYTVLTFVKLHEYRKQTRVDGNQESGNFKLLWLSFIAFLFCAIFISYLVVGGVNALTFSEKLDLDIYSNIGLTILVFTISYFGIRHDEVLNYYFNKNFRKPIFGTGLTPDVSAKMRFSEEMAAELTARLERHMDEQESYLNPELTLSELAEQINVSKHDLTYLLNYHLGKNFFTFVNEYRLKSISDKLERPEYDHLTILSIAYDCGFNSKSTFNSTFKQYSGYTPSEYRKNRTLITSAD